MHKLFYEADSEFKKLKPTKGFKSINIFRGWAYYVGEWFKRRLDSEINKNDDFVQITDIKYKLNELLVSYISELGIIMMSLLNATLTLSNTLINDAFLNYSPAVL